MDYYTVTLVFLIVLVIPAAHWYRKHASSKIVLISMEEADRYDMIDDELHDVNHKTTAGRYYDFRNQFLQVYGLVMAADWLQGSYMYSGFRNSHRLSETVIASLFATGFVSAGISALFIGSVVDKHGRRLMCQCYCVVYSLSCLTMLTGNVFFLFIGRAMGGISTTLLYSAFETWMIAEYHKQGFDDSKGGLSAIYSSMAITNGFVAIGSGVVAQMVVHVCGWQTAPFLVSIICLNVALVVISRSWSENFGTPAKPLANSKAFTRTWTASVVAILNNPSLVVLTFALCFFEGSMYVMVYSWPQAIISARTSVRTWGDPPFGLIFANYMGALTLGSFLFAYVSRKGNSTQISSRTVQLALAMSAAALLMTIVFRYEMGRFWAFCLFEFCVGMYLPSMASLKGRLVHEERRGQVYGLMRVPLNVFIVLCLATISEGDQSRENMFMTCSSLLLLSVILMARYVPRSSRS